MKIEQRGPQLVELCGVAPGSCFKLPQGSTAYIRMDGIIFVVDADQLGTPIITLKLPDYSRRPVKYHKPGMYCEYASLCSGAVYESDAHKLVVPLEAIISIEEVQHESRFND